MKPIQRTIPHAIVTLVACLPVAQIAAADHGLIQTDRSPHAKMQSVDLGAVQWTDGFWADRFTQCRNVTLPRLWELAEPWAWNNMLVGASLKQGEAKGCYWEDAWIYKWVESACYLYTQTRDPELLKTLDVIIDVGGEYDAANNRFDHHQKGFEEVFGSGFDKIKLDRCVIRPAGQQLHGREQLRRL